MKPRNIDIKRKPFTGLGRITAVLAFLSLSFLAVPRVPAHAAVLFSEDFSRVGALDNVAGVRRADGGELLKDASGWRGTSPEEGKADSVVYEVPQGLGSPSGTIEVWLKRSREGARKYPGGISYEAFLELEQVDSSGSISKYLTFSIMWVDENHPGRSGLLLYPGEMGPWGQWIPLGEKVKTGEWVHLAFTWGPGSGDSAVYVNGVKRPGYSDRENSPPAPSPGFSPFMTAVNRIVIGRDFSGWQPLFDASIGSIMISDIAKQSFDMARLKPAIISVTDDTFKVAGISGKLVAGDKVSAELLADPGGKASFDMGRVKGIPMEEVPATEGAPGVPAVAPGTYRGIYEIRPGDDYEDGRIVGHFVSLDNVAAAPVTGDSKWTIDTKPVVTFKIDKKDLPADSSTKARIKLIANDANGNPVKGRHLKLTLSTTDEYTGTVGAGDFGENVGATVETRWRGETDAWGEVEFDYVAGFAAKTVILSAKDLDSGGVTVDYLTAYKEASIDIALTPPISRAAARRGIQYILKVEASRTELTADGRSRSVVRAQLLDPNGTPVAGDPVTFTLSSENGTLRTIRATTDSSGTAVAEYTAGKTIGIVVVTATATLRNAQGNVSITLLSDAPAKILLKARPDSLPADGFSRADLDVKVTDINDNPNADTKVEFRIARGGGKLDYADRVTDRFGDASNRYTSGTAPGTASILATVRSKVPTEAELAKARNVLFAPHSPEGDEIRVEKWLKKKGDSFVKGEALVEYTVGRSRTVYRIAAPFDGTMGEQFVEYWDNALVGQTLAVIVPR